MMIANAEQLDFPAELVSQAVEYANLTAGWAFLTLNRHGFTPEQASAKPQALLLEFGALSHLAWLYECADATGLDTQGLPNLHAEETDLLIRIENNSESFSTLEGATLSRRMFKHQMNNVVWALPTDGTATMPQLYLMTDHDPDDLDGFLESLAQAICNYHPATQED